MAAQDTIIPMDTVMPAGAVSQEEAIQCWDEAAEEFAGRFKRNEEFFHKHVINPTLLNLLGDVKAKAVLDLACGEGHFSRKLAEQAKKDIQITGIDSSKALIDVAQKKNEPFSDCIRFLVGDASRLDQLSSNSFDVVVCNMALMFIKRYEETIQEVARVLKPRGLFVLSILHPCFLTPGSGWILEDSPDQKKGKRIGWKTDNYYLRLVYHGVMAVCDTKETYYFCRTLEDYFRALREGGFVVEDLREPLPPKELMERHLNFKGEEKRSLILILKCKRMG
ncbi:MAG TPA: class I SAM-dependent methyltransferase [Thermodesulfobacteriota bacterium]|nr:class I SAM-dependent methyltransferase [Thermodesulfobacteriota bacterium]